MEVKPGYKQTEVGVIPEDWEIVPLGDLMSFQNGVNADKRAYGRGTPFINVLEVITRTHLDSIHIPGRVNLTRSQLETYGVKAGDCLFNRTSETQDEVGLAAVYCGETSVVFGGFVIRGRPTAQQLNQRYVGYGFRSPSIRSQIIASGQGAVRANIGQGDLKKVLIPLPTLAEQEAIAGALSDADALIDSLEQLIAKKRQVKQGVMQDLLTGKKRLLGFEGKWEVKVLGSFLTMPATYGIVKAGDFQSSGIPMVRGGDIKGGRISDGLPLVTATKHAEYSRTILQRDDILIALVGYPGEAARVPEKYVGANISRAVGLLRVRDTVDSNYVVAYLNSPMGRQTVLAPSAGSAQIVVNLKDLNKLELPFPPTVAEQTAIAAILSDMDAEIAALEAKLAKARQVKQGMMQELLTGRTRLV